MMKVPVIHSLHETLDTRPWNIPCIRFICFRTRQINRLNKNEILNEKMNILYTCVKNI